MKTQVERPPIETMSQSTKDVPEITVAPTDDEKQLAKKFDPLSDNPAERCAGAIIRAAVDVRRYTQTIAERPDDAAHYRKQIRAAECFASMKLSQLTAESPEQAAAARSILDGIDWPTQQPVITSPVSYDGTEPAVYITFRSAEETGRSALPA